MAMEGTVVHVWCGQFPDRDAFDTYVRELPREDMEDPLSEFISDQGHPWYDHDWFSGCFFDQPSTDLARMLTDGHGWGELRDRCRGRVPTAGSWAGERDLHIGR